MTRISDALARRLALQGRIPSSSDLSQGESTGAVSKYRNKRCRRVYPDCEVGHASLKEHRRAVDLHVMQRVGKIKGLREQVTFILEPGVVLDGRRKPHIRYVADFVYDETFRDADSGFECWRTVVEDVKSPSTRRTRAYRDRKHLMKSRLNIDICEV